VGYFLYQVLLEGAPGAITFLAWTFREFIPILWNRAHAFTRKERLSRSFKQEVEDSLNEDEARILQNTRFFWAFPIYLVLFGLISAVGQRLYPNDSSTNITEHVSYGIYFVLLFFVPAAVCATVAPRYRRAFVIAPPVLLVLSLTLLTWLITRDQSKHVRTNVSLVDWLPALSGLFGVMLAYVLAHKLDTRVNKA
jgi:hypothetical protein